MSAVLTGHRMIRSPSVGRIRVPPPVPFCLGTAASGTDSKPSTVGSSFNYSDRCPMVQYLRVVTVHGRNLARFLCSLGVERYGGLVLNSRSSMRWHKHSHRKSEATSARQSGARRRGNYHGDLKTDAKYENGWSCRSNSLGPGERAIDIIETANAEPFSMLLEQLLELTSLSHLHTTLRKMGAGQNAPCGSFPMDQCCARPVSKCIPSK